MYLSFDNWRGIQLTRRLKSEGTLANNEPQWFSFPANQKYGYTAAPQPVLLSLISKTELVTALLFFIVAQSSWDSIYFFHFFFTGKFLSTLIILVDHCLPLQNENNSEILHIVVRCICIIEAV